MADVFTIIKDESYDKIQQHKLDTPLVAMLCWGFDQPGMNEEDTSINFWNSLERMVGNSTNPQTFSFPILKVRVKNANKQTVVTKASEIVLSNYIKTINILCYQYPSIKIVTTSCGFNIIYQQQLQNYFCNVNIATSSLLQLPMILNIINKRQKILIITMFGDELKIEHFKNISDEIDFNDEFLNDKIYIVTLYDYCMELKQKRESNKAINANKLIKETMETIENIMVKYEKDTFGAILIECTDFPPVSPYLRQSFKIPVFDHATYVNNLYSSVYCDKKQTMCKL